MNFVDYLIETKNYSALSAVNEYTKQFGRTNPGLTVDSLRSRAAQELMLGKKRASKTGGTVPRIYDFQVKNAVDKAIMDQGNYFDNASKVGMDQFTRGAINDAWRYDQKMKELKRNQTA